MDRKVHSIAIMILITALAVMHCAPGEVDREAEKDVIKQVVHNSIGWALDKDQDLLYSSLAQDTSFFIFHPDAGSTIVGFEAFREMAEQVFMNEAFEATGFEVRDLRINLSGSGDVAWYSAILDDFGEWAGEPSAWINTRWTGVLENRDGKWVIVQMHFSFATDGNDEEAG
jgi:ketosteroid isomerase-like protein